MSLLSQEAPKSKKRSSAPPVSRSVRAGLVFPVGRFHRQLKEGRYSKKIGIGAPVYMAAVLEYLTAEVLDMAGKHACDDQKVRIVPRHIMKAIRYDEELGALLKNAIICESGVVPTVSLASSKSKSSKKQAASEDIVV